jgi:type I restriction enzyme M protein
LKPGGRLAIVLPRSVLTNKSLRAERQRLDALGQIDSIVTLPPETFAATGTQTTTMAVFLTKHAATRSATRPFVTSIEVSNVGFDATGRVRAGNQLPAVATCLRRGEVSHGLVREQYGNIEVGTSLAVAGDLLSGRAAEHCGTTLADVVNVACTGKTPPRSAYTDTGMFILKVGNLGRQAIDWTARDRNFISAEEAAKRRKSTATLMVRPGDILLTSSAHSPKYIAQKVNIVHRIPPALGEEVTFVGEAMLLRCRESINPYVLLAFLRQGAVRARIQKMIRGQTAHLDPHDLLSLPIPNTLARPTRDILQAAELLKEEAHLAYRMAEIGFEQRATSTVF